MTIPLLERTETNNYLAIATALTEELIASVLERERQAEIPELEVRRLRETGLLPLVVSAKGEAPAP